jgi:hypothetical protein
MDSPFHIFDNEDEYRKRIVGDPKDTVFQIIISAVLGLGAFLAFCVCFVNTEQAVSLTRLSDTAASMARTLCRPQKAEK